MHRNSFRFANLAVAFCFLLAFTILTAGSRYAQAQTAAADRGNQSSVQSGGMMILANHTPKKVLDGTALRLDHYNPEQKLRLAIFVTPRDLAGQEKLLGELQDKKSPLFHKWLTADEWNARFGPLAENEQAVVDWAKSQGLTVTNRFANRMLVDVEAPSGVIEQALSVTINHYQVGDEVDFSNDRDPSIPANLSGVVGGIFGLNSIERVKPAGKNEKAVATRPDYLPGPVYKVAGSSQGNGDPTKAPWAQAAASSKGPGAEHGVSQPISGGGQSSPNPPDELGEINPSNLYSSEGYSLGALYSLSKCCNVHNDSTGSPADTSVALVTFSNYQQSDVNTFFTYYGLAWNTTAFEIDGDTKDTSECTVGATGCSGLGDDDEADLDVEWSTAFSNSFGSANDTAHVYVYEGGLSYYFNWFDLWNYVLTDAHAHVISTSWAWTEEGQQAGDPGWMTGTAVGDAHYIFNALVAQGNTLIAAAGDQGPTSGCANADQVYWPANDPDFLAAGGTSLNLNYDGTFGSETAWVGGSTLKDCQSNGGGGGGGISEYFSAPSWQSGITYEEMDDGVDYIVSGQGNRMMPDMSLNATGNFQWYFCSDPACPSVTTANGWQGVGGTSIVAPELAGFYAQVNSYLNSIGHICGSGTSACEPIGNPDPILYYEGMDQGAAHNPFYDTTQGCVTNYLTDQNPDLLYFCATTGYDLATGWGSANLLQLAWAYNFYIIPSDGVPSVSFSGPATNTWFNTDQEISWTVSDGVTSGTAGLPAPGVAGFTQGWDSIPADVYSEPNGGSGNSFYSGPQYAYGTTGCLSFNGLNGCSAAASPQGCHTVNVGAWDNQGFYTGAQTYGPVCYDTVAPTITASTNPTASVWEDQSVVVTLAPIDPGGGNASGIYKTYYALNNESTCQPGNVAGCSVYNGPVTVTAQGQTAFYYFTEDNAGNWSTWWYQGISIDTTKPITTSSLAGNLSSGIYYSVVTVTLNWTTTGGSGVANTYYTLDGGTQTTYSAPFNVSAAGSHTVKSWSVSGSGETGNITTTTFTIEPPTAALMTSPAPSSTLVGPKVTFSWPAQTGATNYSLRLGTTSGSNNLYGSGYLSTTSATVATLPTNGAPVYAQLTTYYNNDQLVENYTYTAATQSALSSPANNSVLAGPKVTFTWTTAPGSTNYALKLGTTAGSNNLYGSGYLSTTSATPTTLPTNGEPIYATLTTFYGTIAENTNYTFTAATQAALTSPANNSVLVGPKVTFTWTAAPGSTNYSLKLGTTVGSNNIYGSGYLSTTSATPIDLPANGEPVYATLTTYYGSIAESTNYTFTAATQAALTSPANDSVLTGPNPTFEWTTAAGATNYSLALGTTVGSNNLYGSGYLSTTSATPTNLPTNGETIYAKLTTYYGTVSAYTNYTFTATTQAALTSPANASVLVGPKVTFTWTAATGATDYSLKLGTTVGSNNLYGSGYLTATSATPTNLPANGETIYATLTTYYGSIAVSTNYAFVAATQAALTSPANNAVFTSSSQTFEWTTAPAATNYSLKLGTTAGSNNLYGSGYLSGTSATATGLPTNGETIYGTLTTYYGSVAATTSYTFTAYTSAGPSGVAKGR